MKSKKIILSLLLIVASISAGKLHEAAEAGDYDRVQELLSHGASVDGKSVNGYTPLHYAVVRGYKEVAQLLLSHGAKVDAKNNNDWTPLHMAALEGYKEVAQLLLSHGAQVDQKDNNGATPLHGAAAFWGHKEVAQLLISHGAVVDEKDNNGATPLHGAAANGHKEVAKLLIYSAALQGKRKLLLEAKNQDDKTAADRARIHEYEELHVLLTDEAKQYEMIQRELKQRNNVMQYLRNRELGLKPRLR